MNQIISYQDIAGTAPQGLKRKQDKEKKLNFWVCLAFYVLLMVVTTFIAGMLSFFIHDMILLTFINEIMLLLGCLLFVLVIGASFKEVFPIKKPRAMAILGVLVMVPAAFMAANLISVWTLFVARDAMMEISDSMSDLNVVTFFSLFVVSVSPAVCEEALHRGVLTNGMRHTFRNKWLIVILGGILFGTFHIYPVRMAAPALLGALFTWILLKTDNIVYTALFHFLYNGSLMVVQAIAQGLSGMVSADVLDETMGTLSVTPMEVGASTIFYGLIIPILIYTGGWMIKLAYDPVKPAFLPKGREKTGLLQILVPTGALLVTGLICIVISFV